MKKQRLQHSLANNNNNKIIILPLIIQKQILKYLFEEIKSSLGEAETYISDDEMKSKCEDYALVNQFWFDCSQKMVIEFYEHVYSNENEEEEDEEEDNEQEEEEEEESVEGDENDGDNGSGNENEEEEENGDEEDTEGDDGCSKYNLLRKDKIKKIRIDFSYINDESVTDEINTIYKSLESIEIYSEVENYIGDSLMDSISNLEKLENKEIIINFALKIDHSDCENEIVEYEIGTREIEGIPFTFKTNKLNIEYDICDFKYPYIYYLVKLLNPKKLLFNPGSGVGGSEHHLQQYHSISKLNQNYECVDINDFIPLYSLYRFLQSPNLIEFNFNLQYHFISKLYDIDEEKDSGKSSKGKGKSVKSSLSNKQFKFDEMDKFEFISFEDNESIYLGDVEIESRDDKKGTYYGINEDNQKYCAYNLYDQCNESIPPYSKQLWNECMKLLLNNKTITNLSITCQNCNGCYWDKESTVYNINFLNDFMDMFAKNKTITSLTLKYDQYGYSDEKICNENKELIFSSIVSMLDRNTTLKHLSICYFGENIDTNEIKKQTRNTNCEIAKI